MNIRMAGIDYSMAGIDVRARFSLTRSRQEEVYAFLRGRDDILGAVVITTCNRTEIFLSCAQGDERDPFDLLCAALGEDPGAYAALHRTRAGREAYWHLCRLACGAKSQIWGEDQIITQVKNAAAAARECGAIDSYLEVLFRSAITAAKKIKTEVKFPRNGNSVADKALSIMDGRENRPRRGMVIGNGEVGRLVAETLNSAGYEVHMTLRQYRHGEIEVAPGVRTLDYAERYACMSGFDAVVSATLSPHYTLDRERFAALETKPELLIDLAVPRDIDPAIAELPGISLFDVDTLGGDSLREDRERLMKEIDGFIEKYYADFLKWLHYKETGAV